ncbi:uncharacterized protein LOC113521470 [Galleria mellonella]|uniref:Uncharacterized protein LOC113521470 n=1 Tax=Galleria mellonella TaxID=7137 RepID=A0A6J1X7S7_GALME|nr:uncharacterized protein LOC113521470 [Galleria mellonella]
MDDVHSLIINIPISKVFTKESNDSIKKLQTKKISKRNIGNNMQKTLEISLGKYYMLGNNPLQVNDLKREELLLAYRSYMKKQENEKHKQRLGIDVHKKYKIVSADMKKRLYVETPCDHIYAITDIDKGFFTNANGRALSDHVPLFKSLKSSLSSRLRLRQAIGYRNDGILNIEANYKKESAKYEQSFQRYVEQVKYFDIFIFEDYHKSVALLQQWDELKVKVNIKISELQNFAAQQFPIISTLMGLDYMYKIQQKYGRFLYYLSPPSWRIKNREFAHSVEIKAKGFDLAGSEEETFTIVFENMQRECYGNLIKPALYFTHPRDLLDIFDGLEKQQLHHFTYVTHLAPLKKILNEEIKTLKEFIAQDSALLINTIKTFEILLKFSEERCAQLKNRFYKVLYGLFFESVSAPEVLKLFLHLEFSYEKVICEKQINLDIMTMAKGLETMYMDYSKALDEIHSDTVNRAVKRCMEREQKKIRRAKVASRELRVFDRLERNLLRAHAPFVERDWSKVFIKKTMITKKLKQQYCKPNNEKNIRRSLNESELEYLNLFTEWTQNEDPAKYLHFDENRMSK